MGAPLSPYASAVKVAAVLPPPPIGLLWDPMSAPFPLFAPTSDQLELQLTDAESRLKSVKATWTIPAVLEGVLAVLALVMYVFFHMNTPALATTAVLIFVAAGYILYRSYVLAATDSRIATLKKQLEQTRRNLAAGREAVAAEGIRDGLGSVQIDQLVEINVKYLASYYSLVGRHAGRSFVVSLGGGILGFSLIVTGLIFSYTDRTNAQTLSFIASGSGVLTEFIAAVFFYLYNRTVRQMKGYHDSLLSFQNVVLSMKLVNEVTDPHAREKLMSEILGYVLGGTRAFANRTDAGAPESFASAHAG